MQLSPTAHKPLDHGEILLMLIPPTLTAGMLNEEPVEASNKFTKVSFNSNYYLPWQHTLLLNLLIFAFFLEMALNQC